MLTADNVRTKLHTWCHHSCHHHTLGISSVLNKMTTCFVAQEFRRNIYNTDSTEEALDLLDFNYKIMLKSGLSDNGTYLPKAIHPVYNCESPITHLAAGMEECRMVVCGAMEGLMKRAGTVGPHSILTTTIT